MLIFLKQQQVNEWCFARNGPCCIQPQHRDLRNVLKQWMERYCGKRVHEFVRTLPVEGRTVRDMNWIMERAAATPVVYNGCSDGGHDAFEWDDDKPSQTFDATVPRFVRRRRLSVGEQEKKVVYNKNMLTAPEAIYAGGRRQRIATPAPPTQWALDTVPEDELYLLAPYVEQRTDRSEMPTARHRSRICRDEDLQAHAPRCLP